MGYSQAACDEPPSTDMPTLFVDRLDKHIALLMRIGAISPPDDAGGAFGCGALSGAGVAHDHACPRVEDERPLAALLRVLVAYSSELPQARLRLMIGVLA
jgi:hypothetical protein